MSKAASLTIQNLQHSLLRLFKWSWANDIKIMYVIFFTYIRYSANSGISTYVIKVVHYFDVLNQTVSILFNQKSNVCEDFCSRCNNLFDAVKTLSVKNHCKGKDNSFFISHYIPPLKIYTKKTLLNVRSLSSATNESNIFLRFKNDDYSDEFQIFILTCALIFLEHSVQISEWFG